MTSHSKNVALWNDPDKRAIFFQIVILLCVCLGGYYLLNNMFTNLEKRGISTGFSFLNNEAGFAIGQTLIEYDATHTFGRTFFVGLLNTILVSILGIALATILGFFIGVARLSSNWLLAKAAAIYIEVFRNIPLLLQIVFWYFAILPLLPHPKQSWSFIDSFFLNKRGLYLPSADFQPAFIGILVAVVVGIICWVILARWAKRRQDYCGLKFPIFAAGISWLLFLSMVAFFVFEGALLWTNPELKGFNFKGGMRISPELGALLLALGIYTAAFIAEIVRAGIQSVDKGQIEAGSALGLREVTILRTIIIPQAMRVIIPQLTSQYLNLTKNSSLAAAVGYPDLVAVFAGTTLNQTGQAIEIILITMLVYLTLSLSISLFMNWYNAKMALVER